jgi:hypothetical protein
MTAMAVLFLPMGGSAADGPPWKPDYTSPERTVLTYCLARNLPEGGRKIMERAFQDGAKTPGYNFWQVRTMCRVQEVRPVYEWPGRTTVLPDQAEVILEEWDPLQGDAEENIGRTWYLMRKVGEEWKIASTGAVYPSDYPPDDEFICRDLPWWGRPVLSGPDVVVCNYALELNYGNATSAAKLLAPGAVVPDDAMSGLFSADIAAVRPESLAVNSTSAGPMPEDAEVDLDVDIFASQGLDAFRYRFFVHRTGDEWRIARIEYLGPLPTGEGK